MLFIYTCRYIVLSSTSKESISIKRVKMKIKKKDKMFKARLSVVVAALITAEYELSAFQA